MGLYELKVHWKNKDEVENLFFLSGCGNGKYLHINKDVFKLGCDVCRPLVDFAWSQGHEVQMCDGLHLPYRDGCFDAVLSIAGNGAPQMGRLFVIALIRC